MAGSKRPIRIAIIAITTSSSISVKPLRVREKQCIQTPQTGRKTTRTQPVQEHGRTAWFSIFGVNHTGGVDSQAKRRWQGECRRDEQGCGWQAYLAQNPVRIFDRQTKFTEMPSPGANITKLSDICVIRQSYE